MNVIFKFLLRLSVDLSFLRQATVYDGVPLTN